MRNIDEIIIHCSATRENQDISAETIRKWHTDPKPHGRGWRDIGYHYVVRLDGTVELGRPINQQGAHVKGRNKSTIGICYIGGVEQDGKTAKDTLTYDQEQSISDLILALQVVLNKPLKVSGHNEYAAKACPSFNVQEKFSKIL